MCCFYLTKFQATKIRGNFMINDNYIITYTCTEGTILYLYTVLLQLGTGHSSLYSINSCSFVYSHLWCLTETVKYC